MRCTNGLLIEDWGWVHEQDNQKIVLAEDGEKVLVEEKGRNTYRRTDTQRCAKAAEWWQPKRSFWQFVREEWEGYLSAPRTYTLEKKVDGERLSHRLQQLEKQVFANENETRNAIREVLNQYRAETTAAANQ